MGIKEIDDHISKMIDMLQKHPVVQIYDKVLELYGMMGDVLPKREKKEEI